MGFNPLDSERCWSLADARVGVAYGPNGQHPLAVLNDCNLVSRHSWGHHQSWDSLVSAVRSLFPVGATLFVERSGGFRGPKKVLGIAGVLRTMLPNEPDAGDGK